MKLFHITLLVTFQVGSVFAQQCNEEASEIADYLWGSTRDFEYRDSSFERGVAFTMDRGQVIQYSWDQGKTIRLTASQCRFADLLDATQIAPICAAVEKTQTGRRVIPEKERIDRCVKVQPNQADHVAKQYVDFLIGNELLGLGTLSVEDVQLENCGGGFCYIARSVTEDKKDGARIAISSFNVWINSQTGQIYRSSFIDNRPSLDGVVSLDKAVENVARVFSPTNRLQVQESNLFQLFNENGDPHRYWGIICGETNDHNEITVFVDAENGEVIAESDFRIMQNQLEARIAAASD